MCRGELDFGEIGRRFEFDFHSHFAGELANLEPLAKDGLIEIGAGRVSVTALGRLLVRAIAMQFDAYLNRESDSASRRFSRIV